MLLKTIYFKFNAIINQLKILNYIKVLGSNNFITAKIAKIKKILYTNKLKS